MILGIYLGTVLASIGIDTVMVVACQKRLKREGYKFKDEKRSVPEKLLTLIETTLVELLPLVNILKTLLILYKREELYKLLKEEMISTKTIYIEENKIEKIEEENQETNEFINYIPSKDNYKTYSEMTPQERLKVLEQEKESLLEQIEIEEEKVKIKGKKNN